VIADDSRDGKMRTGSGAKRASTSAIPAGMMVGSGLSERARPAWKEEL
jgi:hypothetical protein